MSENIEDDICQKIRHRIKECVKPCPLLEIYANKCDLLCNRNDNYHECKRFMRLMTLIIPTKKK